MPNYEVMWGDRCEYVEAGNPYQACILVMAEGVPENAPLEFYVSCFKPGALGCHIETVGLDQILGLMEMAIDCYQDGELISENIVTREGECG